MKYSKTCDCCGQTVTAYSLNLNITMVEAFLIFANKYIKENRPLKKGEIGLMNSQYTNFQNLRHFGIIDQADKAEGWFLTALGDQFLKNKLPIITPVAHMGGKTLPLDHEAWKTHDIYPQEVYIKEYLVLPEGNDDRNYYRAEKVNGILNEKYGKSDNK